MARYLGGQRDANLPCLTQRSKHFVKFQFLYCTISSYQLWFVKVQNNMKSFADMPILIEYHVHPANTKDSDFLLILQILLKGGTVKTKNIEREA